MRYEPYITAFLYLLWMEEKVWRFRDASSHFKYFADGSLSECSVDYCIETHCWRGY